MLELQIWPVHQMRPVTKDLAANYPLIAGQRVVLDSLFACVQVHCSVESDWRNWCSVTTTNNSCSSSQRWENDNIINVDNNNNGILSSLPPIFPYLSSFQSFYPSLCPCFPLSELTLVANISKLPVSACEAHIYTGVTLPRYGLQHLQDGQLHQDRGLERDFRYGLRG